MRALAELRTMLSAVDPGLVRLRLAAIGTASMTLAAVVAAGVRWLSGQSVTVVVMAAVFAMTSNLAVTETEVRRLRVTTPLMLGPAMASLAVGTLLAPYHVLADVLIVAVVMVSVYVRRFGARGFALGFAAFNGLFLTMFLRVTVAQLPWVLVAAAVGVGSTLLLRGWVFAEQPERTRDRLVRAFRARLHALVQAVADVLSASPRAAEDMLYDVGCRRARLNDAAMLLAENLERGDAVHQDAAEGGDEGDGQRVAIAVVDAELAGERLAVVTERLVRHEPPVDEGSRAALLAGLDSIGAASATGTPPTIAFTLLDEAQRSVSALASDTQGHHDRVQRVAFAVTRLANALHSVQRAAGAARGKHHTAAWPPPDQPHGVLLPTDRPASPATPADSDTDQEAATGTDADKPEGLALSTRQALQPGDRGRRPDLAGTLVLGGVHRVHRVRRHQQPR